MFQSAWAISSVPVRRGGRYPEVYTSGFLDEEHSVRPVVVSRSAFLPDIGERRAETECQERKLRPPRRVSRVVVRLHDDVVDSSCGRGNHGTAVL
jgi:hypothetical protein